MNATTIVAVAAYALSALGFVAFAASFGLRREWEPWHGEATGQKWAEHSPAMKLVILSIMRAAGAGGLALAVATGYLSFRLAQGDASARWALPAVTLSFAIPSALVALNFQRRSTAKPPLGPAITGVLLPVIGLIASLL